MSGLAVFLRFSPRRPAVATGEFFSSRGRPGARRPRSAAMTIAVDRTARFVAFPDSAPMVLAAPVVLRDVEDLHDADLDLVLADKLADAYDAADVAVALARLLDGAPAALTAHDLGDQAAELAR